MTRRDTRNQTGTRKSAAYLSEQPREAQKARQPEQLERERAVGASAAAKRASKSAERQRRKHVGCKSASEDVRSRHGCAPVPVARWAARKKPYRCMYGQRRGRTLSSTRAREASRCRT